MKVSTKNSLKDSMRNSIWIAALALVAGILAMPKQAAAGAVEISLGLSFSRSNYTDANFSWSRRWGTSVGYNFNDRSELEFAFQDVTNRTKFSGYQDTTIHDQIYSLNWVQNIAPKTFPIQPYFKVGIGQLNRDASGSYADGTSPVRRVDSVSGVLGAGLRIFLGRGFAIRSEATSYLEGGSIASWKDNVAATMGISVMF